MECLDLSNLDEKSIATLYNELHHAANAHLRWLHEFNKSLLIDPTMLNGFLYKRGHKLCVFGSWLSDNPQLPNTIKNLYEIIYEHKSMHDRSYKIAQQKKLSQPVSAIDYEAFTSHQTKLLQLIMQLLESLKSSAFLFDPLTNTFNRQTMNALLENEIERAKRDRHTSTIAMLDIDHFKSVNDQFGHQTGDIALSTCASFIKEDLRPYDNIFRYGGEEFLLLLPDTTAEKASHIIERIRIGISKIEIAVSNGKSIQLTVSTGISSLETRNPIEESISKADQALYRAKQTGRNKTVLFE